MSRALRRKKLFQPDWNQFHVGWPCPVQIFRIVIPKKDLSFLPRGRPFTCDFKFYHQSISLCARTSQKESTVVKNIQGKILVERSDKIYFWIWWNTRRHEHACILRFKNKMGWLKGLWLILLCMIFVLLKLRGKRVIDKKEEKFCCLRGGKRLAYGGSGI